MTENERREREAFEAEYRKRFMVPAATPLKFPDVQRAREWFQAGRASLSASTPSAVSAEARHGTREDAYDQIDRFLRNNMDDESYAHYSQALDLVWGTPPADNKENGKPRRKLKPMPVGWTRDALRRAGFKEDDYE